MIGGKPLKDIPIIGGLLDGQTRTPAILEIWPGAPIITSVAFREGDEFYLLRADNSAYELAVELPRGEVRRRRAKSVKKPTKKRRVKLGKQKP